ncbi:MAG: AGE family epimerase/isomerase [Anaerolineae bacterium]|nr:AGE family epimerase/isomerase [Anaerolineae bacterium]
MLPQPLSDLRSAYRRHLLDDVVPFWERHSLDREYGGYFNSLDRAGAVYDGDKAVWLQGRAVWMFSKLYNTVDRRQSWLDAARLGYDFLVRHAFDSDGRMFFSLTREGKPLRKRRYYFSETFAAIAFAEYAQATGSDEAAERAKSVYRLIVDLYRHPDKLPPKVIPQTRQAKSHAIPMILLATSQEMRLLDSDPLYDEIAGEAVHQIVNQFMKPEMQALLETIGPNGEYLNTVEGRVVTPGHAIESAWFLMHEAQHRGDRSLVARAAQIIDWSLERGWDREYGGLYYFVDVEGKPPTQLEWDMKLWWPHTEALYATLLAHHLTGEQRFADWFAKLHEWSFGHFADPEYGEWYGYLHRDGSVSTPLKGGMWKGFFHLPRALWLIMRLLDRMDDESTAGGTA